MPHQHSKVKNRRILARLLRGERQKDIAKAEKCSQSHVSVTKSRSFKGYARTAELEALAAHGQLPRPTAATPDVQQRDRKIFQAQHLLELRRIALAREGQSPREMAMQLLNKFGVFYTEGEVARTVNEMPFIRGVREETNASPSYAECQRFVQHMARYQYRRLVFTDELVFDLESFTSKYVALSDQSVRGACCGVAVFLNMSWAV
jgi:hypothetical protein